MPTPFFATKVSAPDMLMVGVTLMVTFLVAVTLVPFSKVAVTQTGYDCTSLGIFAACRVNLLLLLSIEKIANSLMILISLIVQYYSISLSGISTLQSTTPTLASVGVNARLYSAV